MPKFLVLSLFTIVVACGPSERDPGEIQTDNTPANSTTTRDMGSTGEGDSGNGATPDGGGDEPDGTSMGPDGATNNTDLPTGEICTYDDLQPFQGQCDPVGLEGCAEPEICLTAVAVMGSTATVSSACDESDIHVLPEGAECRDTVERCAPGLLCISFLNECRKLCYPDTSLGCEAGEFCRRPSATWVGIGFCHEDCNQ